MQYTLGLVSVSFRNRTPEEILKAMQAAGLSVVEWGSDVHVPPEKADEIARLQSRYGIKCSSYGTYFRIGVTPMAELENYIRAAKKLGTHILRLWCGHKNGEEYSPEEKAALFALCKTAAEIAEKNGVILCMECHGGTYTNAKETAYELMQSVDSPHFKMYWQPNQYKTEEENIAYAKLLSPYVMHLHVFNWKGNEKYPLCAATESWQKYLACFGAEKTLLLEFMPDGKIETLPEEARALHLIASGDHNAFKNCF